MVVNGRVKWFDVAKGRGFVVSEDVDGDILLLARTLRAFGFGSVAEKARIVVRVEKTEKGWYAVEVLDIERSGKKELPANAGPLEPAIVKWFDRPKGYGFVTVYGRRDDVYLHMETLRECGFGEVKEGDAFAVRVAQRARGPAVCEVRSWDYVNRPRGRRRPTHRPIVLSTGRFGQAVTEDPHLRALIAVLEMLRADARNGPHRWP
jgi:CspA family cold shock protein